MGKALNNARKLNTWVSVTEPAYGAKSDSATLNDAPVAPELYIQRGA